jgi:hypothetical protein
MDGNPYDEIYRVADRSGTTVELSVDPANGAKFRQWDIRQGGQPRVVKEPKLQVELKTHARVEAQFDRDRPATLNAGPSSMRANGPELCDEPFDVVGGLALPARPGRRSPQRRRPQVELGEGDHLDVGIAGP